MKMVSEAEAIKFLADIRAKVNSSNGELKIIKSEYHDYNKHCWSYVLTNTKSIQRDMVGNARFYDHLATLFHWKDSKWSDITKKHEPVHTYGIED